MKRDHFPDARKMVYLGTSSQRDIAYYLSNKI
jgi:hypothetical protein